MNKQVSFLFPFSLDGCINFWWLDLASLRPLSWHLPFILFAAFSVFNMLMLWNEGAEWTGAFSCAAVSICWWLLHMKPWIIFFSLNNSSRPSEELRGEKPLKLRESGVPGPLTVVIKWLRSVGVDGVLFGGRVREVARLLHHLWHAYHVNRKADAIFMNKAVSRGGNHSACGSKAAAFKNSLRCWTKTFWGNPGRQFELMNGRTN